MHDPPTDSESRPLAKLLHPPRRHLTQELVQRQPIPQSGQVQIHIVRVCFRRAIWMLSGRMHKGSLAKTQRTAQIITRLDSRSPHEWDSWRETRPGMPTEYQEGDPPKSGVPLPRLIVATQTTPQYRIIRHAMLPILPCQEKIQKSAGGTCAAHIPSICTPEACGGFNGAVGMIAVSETLPALPRGSGAQWEFVAGGGPRP